MCDDSPQRQTPDSLMLHGFWYRGLPADRVRSFALQDACPHRGMPLSCGHLDATQIECSYHGWRFDALSGQCQLIPSLTADQKLSVDRIYAGSYACEEHADFIWG